MRASSTLLDYDTKSSDVSRCPFFFFFLSVIGLEARSILFVGNKGHSLAAVASLVENGLSVTRLQKLRSQPPEQSKLSSCGGRV